MVDHQLGGTHLRVAARDRELHALVLADRSREHLSLLGVVARLFDEPFRVADTLCRDQDPLCVHARQDIAEPLPFLADQRRRRDTHVVEENLRRRMVHHRADRLNGHAIAHHFTHVDEEEREAFRLLGHLVTRCRARQQDHEVGMLGTARPDLLAVDHIFVAFPLGEGAQGKRVGSARRFGNAECL